MFQSLILGLMAAGTLLYSNFGKSQKDGEIHTPKEVEAKPEMASPEREIVDYQDEYHLRFCDETDLMHRILPLETSINMRDIGGYTNGKGQRIKWDKIYRGEELSHLSPENQKNLDDYGITHVIDLRQEEKAYRKPDRVPNGAIYLNVPVLKGMTSIDLNYDDPLCADKFMRYTYTTQVTERANRLTPIFEILRDEPDAVLYVHCSNGKDRTGFFVALIMLLAGIDEEKIISDYTLTNLTFDKAYEELGQTMADEVNSDTSKVRDFFGVNPDWLKIQLDYIKDNYNSVDDYLIDKTDLTQSDLDKIRENILERIPEQE